MLSGIWGCKNDPAKDLVFEEFKTQIQKKGMVIDSVDDKGLIYISQGELTLTVSLDNVKRDYERDKDPSHISAFVQTLSTYSIDLPANWANAKDSIYISLFPNDYAFNDIIHHNVTDVFSKVYVHSSQDKFSWITTDDLKKWNISESDLDRQANKNADLLLTKTKIGTEIIENRKLGLIEAEHPSLKGALLFAPGMKEKIVQDFGFPFYAVIPVRDFCYIFSEKDFDFFAQRIGQTVVDEFKHSGYPVTTEILKFTDKGVKAVGQFPVQ